MAKGNKMPGLPMGGGKRDPHSVAGPTMNVYGGDIPPNPADALREGPLPVRLAEYGNMGVIRRDFKLPTKPTLHYRDGLDGAAETVTVNERRFDQREDVPTQSNDWDHGEYGYEPGTDANKYSKGPNPSLTERGEPIRGT